MMSSGVAEHGEQAVARAETVTVSTPKIRAKNVWTVADSRTTIAFTGAQGAMLKHLVETVVWTLGTFSRSFLPPALPL
jgi:hypothetical protein